MPGGLCKRKIAACPRGGEVERVGETKPIRVNVRVLVATHRNLEDW